MDMALMTEPQLGGTYDDLLRAARLAESTGCVAFARADHYYSGRDPAPAATDAFATLAGLARDTSRIALTVLVTPLTFRHPAVIAKNAATIHQMSGGRFELGVGTGWMELEHQAFGFPFPPWKERFGRLEDALGYLRHALSGGGRHSGPHYTMDASSVLPEAPSVPIIIGGNGPRRTPALAGRFADEYNHFSTPPDVLAPKIEVMRDAARAAGRDPDAIVVSSVGQVFVGQTERDFQDRLSKAAADRGIALDEMLARLRKNHMPHGSVDQAQSMLDDMAAIGVTKFYLQWLDLEDLDGMRSALELMSG